jgi:hypothetical protein
MLTTNVSALRGDFAVPNDGGKVLIDTIEVRAHTRLRSAYTTAQERA